MIPSLCTPQAASDARTFEEALREARQFHESEVQRLEGDIAATQRRAEVLVQQGRYTAERHEHRVQSVVRTLGRIDVSACLDIVFDVYHTPGTIMKLIKAVTCP